jgi:hypothetical protein
MIPTLREVQIDFIDFFKNVSRLQSVNGMNYGVLYSGIGRPVVQWKLTEFAGEHVASIFIIEE